MTTDRTRSGDPAVTLRLLWRAHLPAGDEVRRGPRRGLDVDTVVAARDGAGGRAGPRGADGAPSGRAPRRRTDERLHLSRIGAAAGAAHPSASAHDPQHTNAFGLGCVLDAFEQLAAAARRS